MELNQVILPALDVAASVAFYRRMGFELIVNVPHYARFKSTVGNATTLCRHWPRHRGPSSTLSAQPSINKSQSSKPEAYNLRGSHAMNSGCGERLASLIRQAMSYVFTTPATTVSILLGGSGPNLSLNPLRPLALYQ